MRKLYERLMQTQARWAVPFLILFALVLVAWLCSIYVSRLNETYDGELITDQELAQREAKANRNVCSVIEESKVECSELSTADNDALNALLASDPDHLKELVDIHGSLSAAAESLARNYIRDGSFIIELGGGLLQIVVVGASIAFTALLLIVAIIILLITLRIYLKEPDPIRSQRAGGIAKSCLRFVLASGATLVGGFVITSALLK